MAAGHQLHGQALIYVIKVVTIFTIAHTITLSLAALGAVSLSSRLVESIIAFSIAVAALNIIVPIFRDRIWLVVFAFGLFHGFGFASVLGEYGIPSTLHRSLPCSASTSASRLARSPLSARCSRSCTCCAA